MISPLRVGGARAPGMPGAYDTEVRRGRACPALVLPATAV
jgi:hypothetical protein